MNKFNINRVIKNIDKILSKKLANKIVKGIRSRTRKSLGVETSGGRPTALAPLSESYIEQRKRLKRNGQLSSKTSPSKSNLTKTGEMLDSLDYTLNKGQIVISVAQEQKDKQKWNEDGDTSKNKPKRIFMNLSDEQIKEIEDAVLDELVKLF